MWTRGSTSTRESKVPSLWEPIKMAPCIDTSTSDRTHLGLRLTSGPYHRKKCPTNKGRTDQRAEKSGSSGSSALAFAHNKPTHIQPPQQLPKHSLWAEPALLDSPRLIRLRDEPYRNIAVRYSIASCPTMISTNRSMLCSIRYRLIAGRPVKD